MCIILAHAAAHGKRLGGCGMNRRRAGLIRQGIVYLLHDGLHLREAACADGDAVGKIPKRAVRRCQRRGKGKNAFPARMLCRRTGGKPRLGKPAHIRLEGALLSAAAAVQQRVAPLVPAAAQPVPRREKMLQLKDALSGVRAGDAAQGEVMAADGRIHRDFQMIMKRQPFHGQHSTSASTVRMISS